MRLPWRAPSLPTDLRELVGDDPVRAWAVARSGTVVVVGERQLYAVSRREVPPQVTLARPWHLVDAGSWDRDSARLTVTWVDREPPGSWELEREETRVQQALWERVQATVVLADTVDLGAGRSAKVVVRRDLASGRLLGQAVLGPGVRSSEPGVRDAVTAALAHLKEQVGLD